MFTVFLLTFLQANTATCGPLETWLQRTDDRTQDSCPGMHHRNDYALRLYCVSVYVALSM